MVNLDGLVEEILDIALVQRRDDAAIIIRDRVEKDVIKPLEREMLAAYRERDHFRSLAERQQAA